LGKVPRKKPYTLVLVEGDTEEIFYLRLKSHYYPHCPSQIFNLGGNWNINKKVLAEVTEYLKSEPRCMFRVFIAIDRESRTEKAPVDLDYIKAELYSYKNILQENIILFEAIQDIESWFFHDVESIFEFLRIPAAKRASAKFRPVEKLNNKDLSRLFNQAKKDYKKGKASTHFINQLNLDLIRRLSATLNDFCTRMEKYK
jgi:hypothetical protein